MRLKTLAKTKVPKWKVFSGKEANRWKKQGNVKNMLRIKIGNWGKFRTPPQGQMMKQYGKQYKHGETPWSGTYW